jgi:predicted Abi (CAAX) family protease
MGANDSAGGAGSPPERWSYFRYLTAAYNRAGAYPVGPCPDPKRYRPAANWIGRLVLPEPEDRECVGGAWLEVQHAEGEYARLIGRRVRLRWQDIPEANARFEAVTGDVRFDRDARRARKKGFVLPERVNGWARVNPFESLAGAYPADEMIVRLPEPVTVDETPGDGGPLILRVPREPVQTTGRFYALARFLAPADATGERWRVAHFNPATRAFDGPEEIILLPEMLPDKRGVRMAVSDGLDRSPANEDGWYLYGALDVGGTFVVQSLAPRGLLRVAPRDVLTGKAEKHRFFAAREWGRHAAHGTFTSTLLCPDGATPDDEACRWREGDAALVIHTYGGYVRNDWTWRKFVPLWGHFAFGVARVVREPIADELHFDIEYHQVYVHGVAGVISGTHHWTRYVGDRQFGFLGTHAIQDVLIRLDPFTGPRPGDARSPLELLAEELERMGARYRVADGRGYDRISPSNNCSQDSNQALYRALKRVEGDGVREGDDRLAWLTRDLRRELLPFGVPRSDWELGLPTLGSRVAENPLTSLFLGLRTWHSALPSVSSRRLARLFLRHGATAWTLRTHLVGGHDPTVQPRPTAI